MTVLDIAPETAKALAARLARTMDLQAVIQDGHVQLVDGDAVLDISPVRRLR